MICGTLVVVLISVLVAATVGSMATPGLAWVRGAPPGSDPEVLKAFGETCNELAGEISGSRCEFTVIGTQEGRQAGKSGRGFVATTETPYLLTLPGFAEGARTGIKGGDTVVTGCTNPGGKPVDPSHPNCQLQ